MLACYVQYKCCQGIHVVLHVKIVAMLQSFRVKKSVLLQQRFPLVFLNGILMLETKGQSKQQAIVTVSYAMLQVPQPYIQWLKYYYMVNVFVLL